MAVTTQILHDGDKTAIMKFTWDTGSAETTVTKVDVSALSVRKGKNACASVAIEQVWYSITSDTVVDVIWDATANITAMSLLGDGHQDYRSVGPISNQTTTGKTGDILFSTIGTPAATSRYTITLALRKLYT